MKIRAKLALLYERCKLDVITTRAVWQSLKLKHLSAAERYYQLQDAKINARGIRCDRAFVTAARDLATRERTAINLKLQELTPRHHHSPSTRPSAFSTPSMRAVTPRPP